MSKNPYKIEGPALISFSGGRTSGFMLRQILDAHEGKLPGDVHVVYANTGKEREETLGFVHEIESRWCPVVWLEYRHIEGEHTHAVVNFETASRCGEPFATLIQAKQYLPNPVMRFCTIELKIRVMKKYMQAIGHESWDSVLGLRADEPRRVAKASAPNRERWTNVMPMATAGHTLRDVRDYWRASPFDLKLEQHEGNCDLCLAAETEVVTADGIKKIGELVGMSPELLVPKKTEQGVSEQGHFVASPVRSFGIQRLWKIVLAGHGRSEKTIFATGDHRWHLARKDGNSPPPKIVSTSGLRVGDKLKNLFRCPIGRIRGNASRIAAMRGFVFGDGTANCGSRPGCLTIHPGKDDVFLPMFEACCGPSKQKDVGNGNSGRLFYGIPDYWKKEFPSLRESRHYLMGWLSGWFAADGCVSETGVCVLTSARRDHLEFARSLCAILGVQSSPVRMYDRIVALPQGKSIAAPLGYLNFNRHHLTSDFFWLPHHRERAIAGIAVERRRYGWTIKSVGQTDRIEEVYCATVEGVGAFGLADGLMTGNCFLKSADKIGAIMRERPELADWWIGQESQTLGRAKSAANATFRSDGPRYSHLLKIVQEQTTFDFGDDCLEACACTD